MKTRIEIIEFSMYECELLETHLHEKAKQGWMIKEITRFMIIYEKCDPQDIYFKVDYINRKNPFTTHKSSKVLNYAQFLEDYDCHHICGNGYRQVIQILTKDFQFHTDEEEKTKLIKKSAFKDFFYTMLLWLFFFYAMISGLSRDLIGKDRIVFDIALIINIFAMFYIVIYPHFRRKPLNVKARQIMLTIVFILLSFGICYDILLDNSIYNILFWSLTGGVFIALIYILEKTKIIKPINENYTSKVIVTIIAVFIGMSLSAGDQNTPPRPKLPSAWEMKIHAPFDLRDENAITNYSFETSDFGEGKSTSYIHKVSNRYLSYVVYELNEKKSIEDVTKTIFKENNDDFNYSSSKNVEIALNEEEVEVTTSEGTYNCERLLLLNKDQIIVIYDNDPITKEKMNYYIEQLGWNS